MTQDSRASPGPAGTDSPTPTRESRGLDDFDPPQPTPDQCGTGSEIDASPAAEDPHQSTGLLRVLRHRHFRIFWIAAFGSFVGNWFEFIGTQWIVAESTGSLVWLAHIGAAQLLPTLVLGLLGGIVADRVNRKKLLLVTQFLMMLIALAFFAVVWLNVASPPVLLALALAQGITLAFNTPAWQVMIPRLVPRSELVAAITIQGISFNAARAIGPAIAGLIMYAFGGHWLFLINAISFVGVLLAVMTTPDAPAPARDGGRLFDLSTIAADIRHACAFMFLRPGPRAALLAILIFSTLATPVLRFLPMFVKDVYHLSEATFGVLTGIMGVGAVAGGFAMKLVPTWYPRHHFIPLSILLGGVWILVFALATDVRLAGIFMFFVGVFWMWAFNSSMSALQLLVDDTLRGRVLAVCNTLSLGLMPAGAYLAGLAGDGASTLLRGRWPHYWDPGIAAQSGIALCALGLIGAGVVMLIWRTPEVDGVPATGTPQARQPGFLRGLTASAHRPRR